MKSKGGEILARKKDSISQARGVMYSLAKFLGDVNAVKKGTVGKRLVRRTAGKATGKLLGKLFK
jgi:hypothetical protein